MKVLALSDYCSAKIRVDCHTKRRIIHAVTRIPSNTVDLVLVQNHIQTF